MSFSLEILTALFLVVVVSVYYYYVIIYRPYTFLRRFPSPPATRPLIGLIGDFKTPPEFLQKLHEYANKCGSMVHLSFLFGQSALLCSDEKFLEFLLTHNTLLKKTSNLKFLEAWVGDGLITSDGGPKWKVHRKMITPAFHFKILEQFVDIFEADGEILIERLSKESGNQSVDVYPYIVKCTLDVICETAMGTKVNVQTTENSIYFQSVSNICRLFAERSVSPLKRRDFYFRLTKDYAVQEKSLEVLQGYTESVIQSKRRNLREKREINEEIDDIGSKKKKAFLDLFLEAKINNQSLTDEEIKDEVNTFMFAGHDTTATAISFILYCIANNEDAQNQIVEEQNQIFAHDKNPKVTHANLQEMKYLENVIKEGLRLYPPVPLFGRTIDQDVEFNGMKIPSGVDVLIFPHGIHMNPKNYPDPEKFDPSRFENGRNRHPFAFLPFSAGPRNCIGQKFAMLEIKSVVSKVVRNFELFPAFPRHDLHLSAEVVLKSLNGVKFGLKSR